MNFSAYIILWCAVSSIFGQHLSHETDDCLCQSMSDFFFLDVGGLTQIDIGPQLSLFIGEHPKGGMSVRGDFLLLISFAFTVLHD